MSASSRSTTTCTKTSPAPAGMALCGMTLATSSNELMRTAPCDTVREAYGQLTDGYRAMSPWFWSDDPQSPCIQQAEEFVYVNEAS